MNNAPNFIIKGAMKCATTTLHEQLSAQPGVFMSELKEPNFFSDDDQFQRGIDWYLSLFASAQPGDLCGESSTHYTKFPTYPNSIDRLKQHAPNVKLIYVMRHPVERLVSQYMHEWSTKKLTGTLSQAIKKHPELYQYSQYSMQLKPYLEAFGPENVLPVFFERVKQYPQAELTRIGEFIGCKEPVVWQAAASHQHATKERLRESAWRDALVNAPILSTIRKTLVPKSFRRWVKGLWQMQSRPQLSPQKQSELEARLDQDLATLGRWLGQDFSCENFRSAALASSSDWIIEQLPKPLATSPVR